METFAALERSVASTATIVKGAAAHDLAGPTPCTEWRLRDLLNHVVGTLWLADGLFADRTPTKGTAPGGLPGEDLVGDDPAAAYAEAAAAALASAAGDRALTGTHETPLGPMPGTLLADFTTLDLFVHGWDVARATGQPTDLDPELAAYVLDFARRVFPPDDRRAHIGAPIAAADDAPVVERLVAFLGRQP